MTEPRYSETDALRAVMEGRRADALRALQDFLPGELRTFRRQIAALANMAARVALDTLNADDIMALHPEPGDDELRVRYGGDPEGEIS